MAEFWALLGILLALLSAPGTFELLMLTVGGVLPVRRQVSLPKGGKGKHLAVVVPAHNEAIGIVACIQSLQACDPGDGTFAVVVVADNCGMFKNGLTILTNINKLALKFCVLLSGKKIRIKNGTKN